MILAAAIAGVIFYLTDNSSLSSPEVTSIAPTPNVAAVPVTQPEAAITDPSDASIPPSSPTTSAVAVNAIGSPITAGTTLFIPKAGVLANVIETYIEGTSWDVSQLGLNVGHLQGTAWLGEDSNIVLSGHVEMSDGNPGVFANLDELAVDDLIRLTVNDENWDYVVREVRSTTPDDLAPVLPTDGERLTLITCGDYNFFQNQYLERLIVVAERI